MRWFALFGAIVLGTLTGTGAAIAGPTLYPDGSLRYSVESRTMPVVSVQAGDLCDIVLQAGERLNQAIISDSLRWKMTDGVSGVDTPHVFVKPTEQNLHALLTVTTSRRTYHVRLVSVAGSGQEFVGFFYPPSIEELRARRAPVPVAAATPAAPPVLTTFTCELPLDAKYRVDGSALLRPLSVCNDGRHTFVNMGAIEGNLPVLVIVGEGNQDQIGNVTFDAAHNEYILDGVPAKLALLRDSNKGQVRVNLARVTR